MLRSSNLYMGMIRSQTNNMAAHAQVMHFN